MRKFEYSLEHTRGGRVDIKKVVGEELSPATKAQLEGRLSRRKKKLKLDKRERASQALKDVAS